MASRQLNGCCTAVECYSFGEEGDRQLSYALVKRSLEGYIKVWTESGHAMLIAHSTLGQKDLNKALRDLGFKRTKFYAKEKCSSTRVAMWHLPLFPEGLV